jgi:hypothetical protein
MIISTSPEFITLCRLQVTLLNQGFGASQCAVYLTEALEAGAERKLIPIVAYPEVTMQQEAILDWVLLPPETSNRSANPGLLTDATALSLPVLAPLADSPPNSLAKKQQILLPLVHETSVLGLLVSIREDRPWNPWERAQIEKIAHSLAIACFLDQRYQWLIAQQHQNHLLEQQQQDILHNLLHQLRSPLTALRTFGKLLLKRLLPSDPNRDIATSIIRESDHLQQLLQQVDQAIALGENRLSPTLPMFNAVGSEDHLPLLLAANPLAGELLQLEPCSVPALLSPLIKSTQAIAQERGLTLTVDIPEALPSIQTNALALTEVMSNLLDNALKYTPKGGNLWLQAFRYDPASHQRGRGTTVAIAVSDTGPGIPPEDVDHLFERHYRGVQSGGQIPGSGLGLAIARDLVRQMQGDIQVFSPAQPSGSRWKRRSGQGGTTFIAWLPISNALAVNKPLNQK